MDIVSADFLTVDDKFNSRASERTTAFLFYAISKMNGRSPSGFRSQCVGTANRGAGFLAGYLTHQDRR